MKKTTLIITLLFVAILVLVAINLVSLKGGLKSFPETFSGVKDTIEGVNPRSEEEVDDQVYEINVENAMNFFLEDFMKSTPPSEGEESFGLMAFAGVKSVPDNGYEIGEIIYDDTGNYAEVEVTLKYSEGDIVKTFYLSKSEGKWVVENVGD